MGAIEREIFAFLVDNGIYPMWSKRGKIYFKGSGRTASLVKERASEWIEQSNIRTREDCERVRQEVKKALAARRQNRPIKQWIKEERPREMLMSRGADALPLSKLLAIVLRTGKEGTSAEELSRRLLNRFRTLREIDTAPISEICKLEGIGQAKAAQIKAALELGKRFYKEAAERKKRIQNAEDAVGYVRDYYGAYLRDAQKEFFHVIFLDVKNKPIDNIEVSKGSLSSAVVDPKEIVKEAALRSASSLILVHNHPSGEAEPSREDMNITDQTVRACGLMGIKVLDHIIIGKNQEDYYSFAESGLIR